MTTINLDLDGVFFDFDTHYYNLFGTKSKDEDDNILWKNIKNYGSFFYELPLFEGALRFLREIDELVYNEYGSDVNIRFLSACSSSDFENTAKQKRAAVRERLNEDFPIVFSTAGRLKYLYCDMPGDILIDDYDKNLKPWVEVGGFGIKHENDFNATLQTLILSLKNSFK